MSAPAAAFSALFAKRPTVIKPGLARIEAGLAHLGAEALLATPTVLIAGTNGKGTTSGFLWQMLSALEVRTGLFTSPHLVHFAERIRVSGESVDDALLLRELERLQQDMPAELYDLLSFFEINTLLALRLFQRLNTSVNLLEVGLGGRWDATNASRPCLTIITSIGLDHQEWLGHTTAEIAGEKAGIMRPGVPVIWGGDAAGDAAASDVLRQRAEQLGAPFWQQGQHFGPLDAGHFFIDLPLPGSRRQECPWPRRLAAAPPYLRDNFLKAAAAMNWWIDHGPVPALRQARLGVAVAALDQPGIAVPPSLRARFERVTVASGSSKHELLLDVCHNPDGARAVVRGLRETSLVDEAGGKVAAFVSILADKDCDEVLRILRTVCDPVVLFAVSSERSWSVERIAPQHRDLPFYPSFAAAWAARRPSAPAASATPAASSPVLVCGSVHAVGEVCAFFSIPL